MTKLILDESGYKLVWMPQHPNAKKNGYIYEHRLIMANYLGRTLLKSELIHHINDDRGDNRIENLKLLGGEHEHNVEHNSKLLDPDYLKNYRRKYRADHKKYLNEYRKKYKKIYREKNRISLNEKQRAYRARRKLERNQEEHNQGV